MKDPIFPLISALSGYRLVIINDNQFPGVTDEDIIITKSLYNKMKTLCPDAFKEDNK